MSLALPASKSPPGAGRAGPQQRPGARAGSGRFCWAHSCGGRLRSPLGKRHREADPRPSARGRRSGRVQRVPLRLVVGLTLLPQLGPRGPLPRLPSRSRLSFPTPHRSSLLLLSGTWVLGFLLPSPSVGPPGRAEVQLRGAVKNRSIRFGGGHFWRLSLVDCDTQHGPWAWWGAQPPGSEVDVSLSAHSGDTLIHRQCAWFRGALESAAAAISREEHLGHVLNRKRRKGEKERVLWWSCGSFSFLFMSF